MSSETCPKKVWRGDAWHGEVQTCGKPVKRRGLCGVHANGADREEANRDARADAARRRDLAVETAKGLTAALRVHFYPVGEHVAMDAEVAADVLRLGLIAPVPHFARAGEGS